VETLNAAVLDAPLNVAVTVTAWVELTVPACAVKLADADPAATATDAGTVTAALLLVSATTAPPLCAALVSVTEQELEVPEDRLAGLHWTEDNAGAAAGEIVKEAVFEIPLAVAVTVAVCVEVTALASTVNDALVEPTAMAADAGVVRYVLLSESATVIAAVAAPLNVTVQVELPGPVNDVGVQASDCSITGMAAPLTTPPVPVAGMESPVCEAATGALTSTAAELSDVFVVAVTTATTPFAMPVEFIPETRQVYLPAVPLWQDTDLPAAAAEAPAATVTWLICAAGYSSVHCKAVGAAPEAFRERFRTALAPGATDAEERVRLADCPKAGMATSGRARAKTTAFNFIVS
jgi:hypothetical protein